MQTCGAVHPNADQEIGRYGGPQSLHDETGTSMQSPIKVNSPAPLKQSEHAVAQKARASALERADDERAQKRRDNDARLDVNASKWRYVCLGA
jgi:hypothetical protein